MKFHTKLPPKCHFVNFGTLGTFSRNAAQVCHVGHGHVTVQGVLYMTLHLHFTCCYQLPWFEVMVKGQGQMSGNHPHAESQQQKHRIFGKNCSGNDRFLFQSRLRIPGTELNLYSNKFWQSVIQISHTDTISMQCITYNLSNKNHQQPR